MNTLNIRYITRNTAHRGIITKNKASVNKSPVEGITVKTDSTLLSKYIAKIAIINTVTNFKTMTSKGSFAIISQPLTY